MGERYQTKYIMLVHGDERYEQVRAPEDFTWKPYPTYVEMADGKIFEYFYCREALPHYREVTR